MLNKCVWFAAMVGFCVAISAATPLSAPGQKTPRGFAGETDTLAASAAFKAVEAIALARRLASFGERERSSLALLAAVQILINNPTTPLDRPGVVGDDVPGSGVTPPLLDVQKLLAEARALSAGDPSLKSLITQLEAAAATRPRGTGSGPRQRYQRIAGGERLAHTIPFIGKELAVVYVSGDAGTSLELGVYDRRGKLVASDVTRFGDCLVRWVPTESDRYRVEVKNRDGTPDWYLLITN